MQIDLYMRTGAVLFLVLGLIFLTMAVLKQLSPAAPGMGRIRRRIGIAEVLPLDPRRRLVLVKHNDREHLLLVGGPQDVVVGSETRKTASEASPPPSRQSA